MTTTPESRQEPTAAQLIAIALGTSPPVAAEAAPATDGSGEAMPPAAPATPA